jgi:hypothetical protein
MVPEETTIRNFLENLLSKMAPKKVPSCRIKAARMADMYGFAATPASYK